MPLMERHGRNQIGGFLYHPCLALTVAPFFTRLIAPIENGSYGEGLAH